MKQVLIKNGKAMVEEIPTPQCESGFVLVAVNYSCISAGTEISSLKNSGSPLWQRAIQQPQNVKKVLQSVNNIGLARTYSLVTGQLSAGNPTGYSAAGTILAVGEDIRDLQIGDRVACAGAQCAHHAEIIAAPRNLTVPVPDNLDFSSASTVTLGAIALQGVRRASPTLGETFVVLGMGILGQLTAQILQANGCHVIGLDIDLQRVELAKKLGMEFGFSNQGEDNISAVQRLTQGIGADGVIITAATSSNALVADAFKMSRKKGRVVLVGDVGLSLNRSDFYQKEIDFLISCSYGPGRYDGHYEEQGLDYPIGYVRWTENRNMSEYLRLIANGKINVNALISETVSIEKAPQAYEALNNPESNSKPLLILLHYPNAAQPKLKPKVINSHKTGSAGKNKIRLALAGAGGFAKGMHLPNLTRLNQYYHLQAVMSRSGHNAKATAQQFCANYATTDYQELLADPDIDAILIATRHDLHAELTLQALQAGKHVLVEKPLSISSIELSKIAQFYADNNNASPILLTGFNRRFSNYCQQIQKLIATRTGPMIINYRMNAGYIPMDHWVHGVQGGGRNLGEACHIYDLFTFFTDSVVTEISGHAIATKTDYYSPTDNFIATMRFTDGTVANLIYTALGHQKYPKEQMEIFYDGAVITLNDYKSLTVIGKKYKGLEKSVADKGQLEELTEFARAIQTNKVWPIPLWQQVQATEISFQIEQQLRRSV